MQDHLSRQSPSSALVPSPIIQTTQTIIACDGGADDGVSGHPLVYLKISKEGWVECPYCDRVYQHQKS